MPKGKARKDNPDMYQGPSEPSERTVTTQATAHRRGGTHKVRHEDRTNSVYDTYNYKELLDAAKERGIYRKDMKKVEMAWALKRHDDEAKRAEHAAIIARRRAQQEAQREQERLAAERHRQIEAKHRRRLEKMEKKDRDESASDDIMSETDIEAEHNNRDEYAPGAIGQALSDSSWDSTSTESSTASVDLVAIKPSSRLRLFEWPYPILPSTTAPSPLFPVDTTADLVFQPRQMSYAPLRLMAALSRQKMSLPGGKYPVDVAPDFAPVLPDSVREGVRKGVLEGVLRNVVVETGAQWVARTIVQGWNGHLYFFAAPRRADEMDAGKAGLAGLYRRYKLEERNARRVTRNREGARGERESRRWKRRAARIRRDVEVFETCRWRPRAVGFVPAFLDWGCEARNGDGEGGCWEGEEKRNLDRLRYVRFKGCDVPHYFFWARGDEDEVGGADGPNQEGIHTRRLDKTNLVPPSLSEDTKDDDENDGNVGTLPYARFPRKRPYKLCYPQRADDEDGDEDEDDGSDTELEPVLQEIVSPTSAEALCCRSSSSFLLHCSLPNSSDFVAKWLDDVASSEEISVSPSPLGETGPVNSWPDDETGIWDWGWREEGLGNLEVGWEGEWGTGVDCPFSSMDWKGEGNHEKARYVRSHSAISLLLSSHLPREFADVQGQYSILPRSGERFCGLFGDDEGFNTDVDVPARKASERGLREMKKWESREGVKKRRTIGHDTSR